MLSTYPGGSRGVGLLLLRSAVGVVAISYGVVDLGWNNHPAVGSSVAGIAALISGASLLAGFLTPVAGVMVAAGAAIVALSWFPLPVANQSDMRLMTAFVAVIAAAMVPLGPGAFSVDARLFGRREIIIPRASYQSKF